MHTVCDKPHLTTTVPAVFTPLPWWKRSIDLACCVAALPVLAVCTLVMTIITKIVSPGPVFFRQERIGYKGRRFKIYKFRSMTLGADTAGHQSYYKELIGTNAPMMKLDAKGDSRLLPGAWLLRASGLDELPQLINVLRGEMSLVGPRPCIPSEFEQYLPWQHQRFDAMPGLTGLWQVSGKNRTTFEEMIRLDIKYAQTVSPFLDLKIVTLTPAALLVQIYDTKINRKKTVSPQKIPTMSIARLRASSQSQSPF